METETELKPPERLFVQLLGKRDLVAAYEHDPREVHDNGKPVYEYAHVDHAPQVEQLREERDKLLNVLETRAAAEFEMLEGVARENDQLREALERIAAKECMRVYPDCPEGNTCLDYQKHAGKKENKFVAKFRAEVLNANYPCSSCQARAVLSTEEVK